MAHRKRGPRHHGRYTPRKAAVELRAEARQRVADLNRMHDDDSVSMNEFIRASVEFVEYLNTLPKAEANEAGFQVAEHAAGRLLGRRVRVRGIGRHAA